MSWSGLLPENQFEIFSRIPASSILQKCTVDKYLEQLCEDDRFWRLHINNNHNIDMLENVLAEEISDNQSIWDRLLNEEFVRGSWKRLALYLEDIKVIDSFGLSNSETNIPIPVYAGKTIISGYNKIKHFVSETDYCYGNNLTVIYANDGTYKIIPTTTETNKLTIPFITGDTYFKDVIINGKKLNEYIQTLSGLVPQ
jgi:hypothetical protein